MYKFCRHFFVIVAPVLAQQVSPTINTTPSREFGQPTLSPSLVTTSPNLVEGREVNQPFSVAFDTSVSPPIMYVADTFNNRVLAWKNPASLGVCGTSNPSCGFADSSGVIGQRDLFSTLAGGPGGFSGLNSGLNRPSAVAVDANGNLYVLDAGNNRILRYPAPFKQTGALLVTDLVIGQKTVNAGTLANEGNQLPSAKTLALSSGGLFPTTMAIDPSNGALWVPDIGNNRVLRFPASELTAGKVEPVADIVLGQVDFTTASERPAPQGTPIGAQFYKGNLRQPSSVAIAATGALFVGDGYSRVMYYLPGISSGSAGIPASRILGLGVNFGGQANLPIPNQYQLTASLPGVIVSGNNLYVADTSNHRVVKYDTPDTWPQEGSLQTGDTKQFSPPMSDVTGQTTLTSSNKANKGQPEPDATTLNFPIAGAFLGSDLWVVDLGNNRVISFPQQGGKYTTATRLVGQLDWPYFAANIIEGREVNFNSGSPLAGVAIDKNSNPPHMYVADTYNNRILCFNDARNIQIGMKADIVIGQPDFYRSLVNGRTNDAQLPNQLGLNHPSGLSVDGNGNLYVADTGNGRVLRFASPFNQTGQQTPNLVLGQFDFTQQNTDVSIQSLANPVGLAMFSNGSLAVSDITHHRVVIYKKPSGGDFTNGQSASIILGQPNPNSKNPSSSAAGLNTPLGLGVDSSDRLYVADFGNSRLVVWTNTLNQSTGASSGAQFQGIIQQPQGIVVSQATGEIWVSNTANSQIIRLPEFNTLILNSTPTQFPSNQTVQAQTPAAAITLDGSDNLVVAESANRVTQFFAQLVYQNAASFNSSRPIAPGMLTSLYRNGKDFSFPTGSATTDPWPTVMNDFQVTVNGQPAPIYGMAASVLNFQVPTQNVPSSGTVEFLVKRVSTNEIVAAGTFQMAQYSPAFFSNPISASCGQIAARNDGGAEANTPSTPVSRDGTHFISFFLTGAGVFDGGPGAPPADGKAPTEAAATHDKPTIISAVLNGAVPDSDILYSGAGGFAGGWQINMKVSNVYAPGSNNVVVVQMNGTPSNLGVGNPPRTIICTFSTK